MLRKNKSRASWAEPLKRGREQLRSELRSLALGEALPPIRVLQEQTGLGRVRLERILGEFEQRGLIERRPRSGIYKIGSDPLEPSVSMIELVICDSFSDIYTSHWFSAVVAKTLAEEAGRLGFGLRFQQFPFQAPVSDYEEFAAKCEVKNAIIYRAHMPDMARIFESYGIATVSIYPRIVQRQATNVLLADEQVVSQQLNHLWSLGHTCIGYFDPVKPDPYILETSHLIRREAYYRRMAEHGYRVEPHWVRYANGEPTNIFRAMESLFARTPRPTAVIVGDNQLTSVYRFLEGRGFRIGKDVSVMGTDDLPDAVQVHPFATTVRNPRLVIAQRAFEILQGRSRGEDVPDQIVVEPELVVRESTGPVEKKTKEKEEL